MARKRASEKECETLQRQQTCSPTKKQVAPIRDFSPVTEGRIARMCDCGVAQPFNHAHMSNERLIIEQNTCSYL